MRRKNRREYDTSHKVQVGIYVILHKLHHDGGINKERIPKTYLGVNVNIKCNGYDKN